MPKLTAAKFAKLLKKSRAQGGVQAKVFGVLRDKGWHCRHELAEISNQAAGGGGIKGLKSGSLLRPGLRMISERRFCSHCRTRKTHDCWTGGFQRSVVERGIPRPLKYRILAHYGYKDVVEEKQRHRQDLVIDHKFPKRRWNAPESRLDLEMSVEEIEERFQVLRKGPLGNQNKLKDAACAHCYHTGERGTPFGISFFYSGGSRWPVGVAKRGRGAERGCVGCGWYDFATWRRTLNAALGDSPDRPG